MLSVLQGFKCLYINLVTHKTFKKAGTKKVIFYWKGKNGYGFCWNLKYVVRLLVFFIYVKRVDL
jgi:hypothetical protein